MSTFLVRALLVICFVAGPAHADQNDPALEALFDRLAATSDREQGRRITGEIWSLWNDVDDSGAGTLLRNGVILMHAGHLPGALALFDRLVARAPGFAEGWNKRATVLYLLDRNAESMEAIRRTLELEPRHFGALSGLGLIYLEQGQYEAALVAFEKTREINPFMPGVEENIEHARALAEGSRI